MLTKDSILLIIAPHSDDDVIGCGGLIAKAKDIGAKVSVVLVSVADIHFYHQHGIVPAKERLREFEAAMNFLNVDETVVLFRGFEQRLDTVPKRDLVTAFDECLNKSNATHVFIPYPSFHQDHQVVFDTAYASLRPSPDSAYPSVVVCYEYPQAFWSPRNEVNGGTLFVDIEKYIDTKIDALCLHKSQLRQDAHLFSPESVRLWAQVRGRQAGLRYAEMFKILRMIA
jgi:LmbE family N-acetylglucosaminyl deacetylase